MISGNRFFVNLRGGAPVNSTIQGEVAWFELRISGLGLLTVTVPELRARPRAQSIVRFHFWL